ncbi:uncharacterized protein [Mytilus edulis]|uniref:uncharacterized protein n=1 Tax=Mytilus edulis TaxID=6550 RepID=UPI0039EF9BE8
MATKGNILCGVCEVQDVTTVAEHWCPECDDGLCSSCLKYHTASKSSRNHDVISVDNYSKLPPSIASIKQHCPVHDKKFQNYCPQHESLCCPICISTVHRKCEVLAIDDIIRSSKESSLIEHIEKNIDNMKLNIDKITKDREENLKTIKNQRQKFQTEIRDIRGKINSHLDKLEQQILNELQVSEDKITKEIEHLLSNLTIHNDTVSVLQNTISDIKSYASDLQTFLGSKRIEEDVIKEEQFLHELTENGSLEFTDLLFIRNDKLSDILSTITTFGAISTKMTPPSIIIRTENENEAQLMSVQITKPKSIDDINLLIKQTLNLQKGNKPNYVTGCNITPSGKMIFIDFENNRVIVLNDSGTLDCEMFVSNRPVDVTCIDDKTVAVSHNWSPYEIDIADITTKKVVKVVQVSCWCCGVSLYQDKLVYYEQGTGIKTVSLSGGSTSSLVKQNVKGFWNYVTTFENKLYHTCLEANTVTCYTMAGQMVWEYKDKFIIDGPCGVTVDKEANVYVASQNNDSVVILSPDGTYARTILTKENGIDKITGIRFSEERNILLIVNQKGTALLYDVK